MSEQRWESLGPSRMLLATTLAPLMVRNLLAMGPPEVACAVEGWGVIPAAARCGTGIANGVVPEEEENVVADYGPTDSAAELVELGVVALRVVVRIPALIGIEAGTVELEEPGAVVLVGAIFRDDLDLRAAETAELRRHRDW